jgi:hypothetical protein
MSFPTVVAVNGGNATVDATSVTINLPDGSDVANRLILLFFTSDGGGESFTWPTGFTEILAEGRTDFTNGVAYQFTTGSEGYASTGATTTLTITSVEQSAHTTYLLSGVDTATPPEAATATTGTSTAPNSGSLNPAGWGTEDTLWFTFASANGLSSTTPRFSGYPTNYTNGRSDISAGGNGVVQGVARRELNAASEDPGAFTIDTSAGWRASTIGVRPSSSIVGAASLTLDSSTVSAAGALSIAGAASVSTSATVSSAGALSIVGSSSMTMAGATISATGSLSSNEIIGAATLTLESVSVSSAGSLLIKGASSTTVSGFTVSSSGALPIVGTSNITTANATVSSSGTLAIVGSSSVTTAGATVGSSGVLSIKGAASVTIASATLSSAGVSSAIVTGSLSVTLDSISILSAGVLYITSQAGITLENATVTATGAIPENATGIVYINELMPYKVYLQELPTSANLGQAQLNGIMLFEEEING